MLVVDASVAVKWFFQEPGHGPARALLDRGEPLSAPALILAELTNAVWKRHRRHEITRPHADRVLRLMSGPFSTLVSEEALIAAAGVLVLEHDHPVYDCLYLALALREGATLVTADRKLASLAGRAGAEVELM